MATVSDDVVDSARVGVDNDGWYESRVKMVTGLTSGSARQNITEAINAVIAVVGNIGASHPEIDGPKVSDIEGQSVGDTVCSVIVTYRTIPSIVQYPSGWDWGNVGSQYEEVGATLESILTNEDYNGSLITVSFNGRSQVGQVQKLVPKTVRSVRAVESSSPLEKAKTYVGTTSDGGTWLCTAILGRKNQTTGAFPSDKWDVTYDFEFKEDGWTIKVYFTDESGKPHPGITAGNGIETVILYADRGRPI